MANIVLNKKNQLPEFLIEDITGLQTALNSKVDNTNQGKVKLTSGGSLDYLSALISTNFEISADKLDVTSLKNLVASITELNYLQGATSNIQAQINALDAAANFVGTAATKAEITTKFPNPDNGDMAIVIADETKGGVSTIYVFGTIWDFAGEFKVQLRDFTTQPINLTTEVTGKLPSTNINDTLVNQVSTNATNITALGGRVDSVESDVDLVETAVTALDGRITTAESDIDVLQGQMTTLNGSVTTLDSRVDTVEGNITTIQGNITTLTNNKVDKIAGKGLSTEDYTTAEKTKLSGIADNANNYVLPIATDTVLGGVKQGSGITIGADGTISSTATAPSQKTMDLTSQINGSTQVFTLAKVLPNGFLLFYNGVQQDEGTCYTVAGTALTTLFTYAPTSPDRLVVKYVE